MYNFHHKTISVFFLLPSSIHECQSLCITFGNFFFDLLTSMLVQLVDTYRTYAGDLLHSSNYKKNTYFKFRWIIAKS